MEKPPVLVIDDDEAIATTVSHFLTAKGYPVKAVLTGEEALEAVRTGRYAIIISDIYIDQVSGLDILREARARESRAAVILMTARGSVRTTVEAELSGAFDYLAKPFDLSRLLSVVERAAESFAEPPIDLPPDELEIFGQMVGSSPPAVEVYKMIARCARSEETVLIVGETGVGKELVGRAIHDHGARSAKPFVAVDSGAVAGTLWESEVFGALRGAYTGADRDRPGLVEAARGGTLFFDEIGEVPLDFQSKLLRFLQDKEFRPVGASSPKKADVRLIAATNRPLEKMVREGKFREDLYFRLNVLRVDVPPLRERRSDIQFLVRRFVETAGADKRVWLEPAAMAALERYSWPGNVRQLQNTIRRLTAMSPPGPIQAAEVERLLRESDLEENSEELADVETRQILKVLQETGGNKTRAAEILGIQRRTLYKKLARIRRDEARGS